MATLAIRPVTGEKTWTAADFTSSDAWMHRLSDQALADIDRAVGAVRDRGGALDDVTSNDFDLPSLAGDLAEISRILGQGRGFVLIKGLADAGYTEQELGIAFWGIGTHIGAGVSQSWRGDRLGHVRDIGETDRYYTAGGALEMHMDPTDVVGLLCVRGAASGGLSRIASSFAVHNIILDERPDLMDTLYKGFIYSRRPSDLGGAAPLTDHRIPVFAELAGTDQKTMICHYLPLAVRNAAENENVAMTDIEREALALVDRVARRPGVFMDMDFQHGDIQFLNNRTILHARTDYTDPEDPALRRHLLRLWLMVREWPALPANLRMHGAADRAGGGIAKARPADRTR